MSGNDHLFVLSNNAIEAESLAAPLRDRGWRVETSFRDPEVTRSRIEERAPLAVVISLRFDADAACDLACALSVASTTRDVPVVFVGGEPADIEAARKVAPHARFVDPAHVAWEVKRLSLRQ